MSDEYENEPIRGLPGRLPEGEVLLWQGSPSAKTFAIHALHVRPVAGYFVLLALWRCFEARDAGIATIVGSGLWTLLLGATTLTLLGLFAWAVSRTSIYTITSRRVVFRVGVALQKAFNVPFSVIAAANLRSFAGGAGDLALTLTPEARIAYATIWPHARPMKIGAPEPMFRSTPDAARVATILADAVAAETERRRDVKPLEAESAAQPKDRALIPALA